ncbi:GNAT family N-acetyltransferase [Tenacibaculum sp. S7007]|uniref:GNAT family N-acetyltransferase n=1 Tax=Tenacibaculum pelagium TaxID=2759527 RepID=A0A839ALL5_9FLAO|nr:GNAT family N-acetyltransferase [Tenacibaculum pelagium]MBA6155059.1 GNAT family N-acetyltransferase [Tenacibaculum pelagium]
MIEIKKAKESDAEILALLGRVTYVESHGNFIEDKTDLLKYLTKSFSVVKTREDIKNNNNLFLILYVDELPVGYVKLVLKATHENVESKNSCRLERIYILADFLQMKLGKHFLDFTEQKAKKLQFDTMWLSVYVKNNRAIRFYEKNEFKNVGELSFLVNGKGYDNIVFSKKI